MSDHTSDNPNLKTKRCGKGDDCIHPDGPILPMSEYYKGTVWLCKLCMKRYRRQRYQANKSHEQATMQEYYRNNSNRWEFYRKNYYIRKANAIGDGHTLDQLSAQYIEQDGCCHWCGVKVGLKFDIDHAIPLSRGGHDDISNIVVSCRSCNSSKGSKTPEEWREQQAQENKL